QTKAPRSQPLPVTQLLDAGPRYLYGGVCSSLGIRPRDPNSPLGDVQGGTRAARLRSRHHSGLGESHVRQLRCAAARPVAPASVTGVVAQGPGRGRPDLAGGGSLIRVTGL